MLIRLLMFYVVAFTAIKVCICISARFHLAGYVLAFMNSTKYKIDERNALNVSECRDVVNNFDA